MALRRRLLRPAVILPLLLGLGLLLLLATLAGVQEMGDAFGMLTLPAIATAVVWLLAYEVIKFGSFSVSLRQAGLPPGQLRARLLGYATSGVLSGIPGSTVSGAYVVTQRAPLSMSRATGAVVMMFGYEVVACCLLVGAVGLPGIPLAQPVLLGLGVLGVGIAIAGRQLGGRVRRGRLPRVLRRWEDPLAGIGLGLRDMGRPWTAGVMVVLAAGYLLCTAGAIHALLGAMAGPVPDGVPAAVAGSTVAILASLLAPIPFDLGVTEAGGVTGLVLWGYALPVALSALLALRLVKLGVNWTLMVLAVVVLRQDLGALLRAEPEPEPEIEAPAEPVASLPGVAMPGLSDDD